jgi:hypothetical protein
MEWAQVYLCEKKRKVGSIEERISLSAVAYFTFTPKTGANPVRCFRRVVSEHQGTGFRALTLAEGRRKTFTWEMGKEILNNYYPISSPMVFISLSVSHFLYVFVCDSEC